MNLILREDCNLFVYWRIITKIRRFVQTILIWSWAHLEKETRNDECPCDKDWRSDQVTKVALSLRFHFLIITTKSSVVLLDLIHNYSINWKLFIVKLYSSMKQLVKFPNVTIKKINERHNWLFHHHKKETECCLFNDHMDSNKTKYLMYKIISFSFILSNMNKWYTNVWNKKRIFE
jgi:hypothetical protein